MVSIVDLRCSHYAYARSRNFSDQRSATTDAVRPRFHMSTHPHQTQTTRPATPATPDAGARSFALANAKRSFDPFNTRDTPEMFEDRWVAED